MESKWRANGEGYSLKGDFPPLPPRSRLPFLCFCRDCRESGFRKGLMRAGRLLSLQSEQAHFQYGALGASMKGITAEK